MQPATVLKWLFLALLLGSIAAGATASSGWLVEGAAATAVAAATPDAAGRPVDGDRRGRRPPRR